MDSTAYMLHDSVVKEESSTDLVDLNDSNLKTAP